MYRGCTERRTDIVQRLEDFAKGNSGTRTKVRSQFKFLLNRKDCDLRTRRREVQEQQPYEGNALADGNSPEVPLPGPELIAISSSDRGHNDCNVHSEVGNHDSNVSPFVWKKFRQGKGGHLFNDQPCFPMRRIWSGIPGNWLLRTQR